MTRILTAATLPLRLNSTYRQLLRDNENLQLDHKNAKSQLNSAKLDQTKLEAEFSKLKEQYQQLDITSTKLTNQCEVQQTRTHVCFGSFPRGLLRPVPEHLCCATLSCKHSWFFLCVCVSC